jgi:proteasome component ECM29
MRKRLVGELTSLLRGDGGQAKGQLKVTGDTRVFEEGALGAAPAGGRLSTYKELCDLANDLNKPDLIYR